MSKSGIFNYFIQRPTDFFSTRYNISDVIETQKQK